MENYTCVGHPMLNHLGARIFVTERTIQELQMRGYLGRDRSTGLKYFDPKGYELFLDGERGTPWWYELGPDMNGPSVAVCKCKACQQSKDLDDSRLSKVRVKQIVKEVRAKRRNAHRP